MSSGKKHLDKHESVNLNSTPLMLWGLAHVSSQEKSPLFFEKSIKSKRIFIQCHLKVHDA